MEWINYPYYMGYFDFNTDFKFGRSHAKVSDFVGFMMTTKCFPLSCGPVSIV